MDRHRAQLDVYDVGGMFRQAAVTFRASISLFVTLALLSSIYETAVERSALLSGLSFSAQNSNFSFQFAFDPKTQAAHGPHNVLNTDGPSKLDTTDSLLARLLTALLPSNDDDLKAVVSEKEDPTVMSTGNLEEGGKVDHGDMSSYMSESHESRHSTGPISIEDTTNSVDNDENTDLLLGKEDRRDALKLKGMDSAQGSEGSDVDLLKSSEGRDVESDSENGLLNDKDDAGDETGLPRLKIETVSNETKKMHENVVDAIDLAFFTGKFLGGRGVDQGAMPHGGMTVLLIVLLVTFAVMVFLALVGFQHAAALGSVAYSVVCTHMGKRSSTRQAIKSSLKSSLGRLMWLAILHATLWGLQSLFYMKTLFGGVMEMEQVEQLILRLSTMPFAFLAPVVDVDASSFGMAVRIALFVSFDYLFDGVSYCIYVIACWVTIMERNYWGLGAVSRSFNLVKGMAWQAVAIRLIEAAVCGRTARWLLQQVMGQFASALVVCLAEVYFLVLWFIFYMSARTFHDQGHFSHRTLEDFLDRFK